MKKAREWVNGNGTWIWRSCIGVLIAILAFFGTYVFNRVEAMDRTFTTKKETANIVHKVDSIDKKIDKVLWYLMDKGK